MQNNNNKFVQSFSEVDVSALKMPLITVFFDTEDFPNQYVARLFDLDQPTNIVIVKESLEAIRETIPPGLTLIPRQPEDHVSVVEVWV